MCKFCDKEAATIKSGVGGIVLNEEEVKNDRTAAQLYISYDDYTYDGSFQWHLRAAHNHIDASVKINYCPICGKKLE